MRAKIEAASADDLSVHIADKSNPHGVTAEQIGAAKAEDLKSYLPLTGGAMTGAIINKNTSQGIVWSSDALELKALDTSQKTSATARIHENGVFGVELKNSADDFGGHFRVLHGNGYDGVYYNSDAARFDDDHRLAQQSYVDNAVKYRTNPNLLDNWFFGNPVNQRGQTEYTGNATYSIDRWWTQYETPLSIVDGGIKISGKWDVQQYFENTLPIATYTLSLLYKDKTGSDPLRLLAGNRADGDISQTESKAASGLLSITFSTGTMNKVNFGFAGSTDNSATLLAAKLELGDAQTLAHQDSSGNWILNEIPDFGEQLRRCEFYRRVSTSGHYFPGAMYSDSNGVFLFPFSGGMRVTPSIEIVLPGDIIDSNGARRGLSTDNYSIESVDRFGAKIVLHGLSGIPGGPACICDAKFALSADL